MGRRAVLKLHKDPATGELLFDIGYESDASALPIEHEAEHRKLAIGFVGAEAVKGASRVTKPKAAPKDDDGEGNLTIRKSIEQEG